ncbi:LuxR C-terminal-related transcriptional regulator [Zobellia uliginosa]|uniref:LuxR C-terminal-related transcriptional regulator n=1 Tax=Zobellia uliginosa TaxID=143224 RepID=UPI0026E20297|nr:LuxR C-terminal-related transcriptional regulator [Zobellia uliginosa]MDO6516787.1 LuxR C-terminal-related transcriptional regulator [Zobellia uliginosa]
MTKTSIDLFKEIFNTNKEYQNTIIEKHLNKLRELDEYLPHNESFFIVTNTTTQKYAFVSKNFEYALGLDRNKMSDIGAKYWLSYFHPDDLPVWMRALEDLMRFTMTKVKQEDRNKLNYTWNFRVKNSKGAYCNILEHQTPTYFDENGKPIIGIAHCTVTGKGEYRPIVCLIKKLNENNEYEILYHKNYSQKLIDTNSLTNREQDVIRLLALNKTSREIGEKLFISSHTVDGHRRNILKKLNFDSTQKLVQYCLLNQLF